jgi:class 3 adenylate cyclase
MRPGSHIITAIGDAVNSYARLQSLTQECESAVVVSRSAAEIGGLNMPRGA